ncbi:MAG: radical SAM protein [Candidatus Krumholzibacteriia bacterium]
MRGALVFAPLADPTYAPLGLATLADHVRASAPECELIPLDLNFAWWQALADREPDVGALRGWLRTPAEEFYDPLAYGDRRKTWNRAAQGIAAMAGWSRAYLERDETAPELRGFLQFGAALITASAPEWIGFSMLYPEQVLPSLALAKFLAEEVFAGAPAGDRPALILGGASASALRPREVLPACPFIDGVFGGEGEQGLVQLLRGNDPSTIAGLAHRRDGEVHENRKPDTLSAACVQLPTFEGLDPALRWNPTPVLPVVFSRGCKWRRCRFCAHNLSYSGYRRQTVARFADYLGFLQDRWGASHFYFADQYVDAEDLEELSLAILDRGLRLSFHVMGRPTAAYSARRLETMARAGCRWISWGVETGSARLLEACGKGTTPGEISQVMTDAAAAGIFNLMMMIFGLPTSTDEDLQATMDLVADLGPAASGVTSSRFQLFDRTPYAVQAAKYGLRITGREVLFARGDRPVHSLRLFHQERAGDGAWRPPRGSLEIARWKEFCRWTRPASEMDGLGCEHTLLYAAPRPQPQPVTARPPAA